MKLGALAMWFLAAGGMAAAHAAEPVRVALERSDPCFSQDPAINIPACTKIIEAGGSPDDLLIAFYNRGTAELLQNQFDPAFADFSKAIELKPDFDYALHNRAMIYDQRGDHAHAIADFTAAIAASPIGGHYYNRARAYMHAGDFQLAAQDYDRAALLWPQMNAPLAGRCRALAADGTDLAAAAAACDRVVAADPGNSMFLTLRAFVKIKQGDFAGAVADCNAVLASSSQRWTEGPSFTIAEIHPSDALYLRGRAEVLLGQEKEGNADIASALQADATLPAFYVRLGLTEIGEKDRPAH